MVVVLTVVVVLGVVVVVRRVVVVVAAVVVVVATVGGLTISVVSLNRKLASLLSLYESILETSIRREFCLSHWSDLSKDSKETYPSKNLLLHILKLHLLMKSGSLRRPCSSRSRPSLRQQKKPG